jgi:hypothetical protein
MSVDLKSKSQTILSLAVAMEEAGGIVDEERLGSMTAIDLINLIAPNDIRFTNINPKPQVDYCAKR